jgi:hypothetical protein
VVAYAPAGPLQGGPALAAAAAKPRFPNQDVGKNECGPGAVSNSLMYLNAVFNLGLNPADITIDKMKTATGFNPRGIPLDWEVIKDKYMKDNHLPIQTVTTQSFADAMAALNNMLDVEIETTGHVAAVVGITDLGDGKFTLDVAHDTQQGMAGGTKIETVMYSMNTGRLTGTTFFNSVPLRKFVIESPIPEPPTLILFGLGILGLIPIWTGARSLAGQQKEGLAVGIVNPLHPQGVSHEVHPQALLAYENASPHYFVPS